VSKGIERVELKKVVTAMCTNNEYSRIGIIHIEVCVMKTHVTENYVNGNTCKMKVCK
jgi:hypothetical protein